MLKSLGQLLIDPLTSVLALLALSYALKRPAPRVARWMPAAAGAILLLFSLPVTANGLQHDLESPLLTTIQDGVTYDAVIVLGGSIDGPTTGDTGALQFNETVERVLAGFDLLRTGRARFAILSGTSWRSGHGNPEPESRLLARQYVAWGIDPARIVADEQSLNTHENAVESVRIARERGWLHDVLVTSAGHMKRARGCFLKEGLDVDALSVDVEAYDPAKHGHGWVPRAVTLRQSVEALREHVARFIYRLRGWTD